MTASAKGREVYTVEAIPSDITNGVLLGNSSTDKLVSCMIALGTELWATQRRLKVIEAVMAQKGIGPEAIEQFVPSAEQAAAWERDRDRFVDLTFSPLGDDGVRPASADFPQR
jgi:coenzyme F420-reducing hydrogenase delta subunit